MCTSVTMTMCALVASMAVNALGVEQLRRIAAVGNVCASSSQHQLVLTRGCLLRAALKTSSLSIRVAIRGLSSVRSATPITRVSLVQTMSRYFVKWLSVFVPGNVLTHVDHRDAECPPVCQNKTQPEKWQPSINCTTALSASIGCSSMGRSASIGCSSLPARFASFDATFSCGSCVPNHPCATKWWSLYSADDN